MLLKQKFLLELIFFPFFYPCTDHWVSQELSFEAGASRRVKQAEVQAAPGEDRQLSSPRPAHIQPHTHIFWRSFL